MKPQDYTTTLLVNATSQEAFNAINNVRAWWSETVEGGTEKTGDDFTYRHKDLHYSKQKLVQVVPHKKVVWLVTDSSLSFTKNKGEWTGTEIHFDVSPAGNQTQILFTHKGLNPEVECFGACSGGWDYYLKGSLVKLIETGEGQPDKKEAEVVDAAE